MILRNVIALAICSSLTYASGNENETAHRESSSIIGWNWDHVETPFIGCSWLMIASIAKILFHANKKFGEAFPDSALLIIVGLLLGLVLKFSHVNETVYYLHSGVFFLYLLPPIIFDAGYFMPNRQLFENFGSVMMFAVVGTIWNTVAIGVTIAALSKYSYFSINVSPVEAFLFSSLISAVDPVAVITVFEEIHVNEFLFINVFGEALFNDGIAAVLFQIFKKMAAIGTQNLSAADYSIFSASFIGVALGGSLVGVVFAFICAISTRYTQRVKIIGPVFIFVFPYFSYITAELMGLSSILAICCCGIVMKQYVKRNVTHDAANSVKYFVKMLAQSSETVVFMFLGLSAISTNNKWDIPFIIVTLVACLLYRTIGVIVQCAILNQFRSKKFTLEDMFVMSYGGLRGAIAFGLLSSIPSTVDSDVKAIFTTTTIVVICFTVFFQGTTIRPLLNWLKVEKQKEYQATMVEKVYNRYFDYTMAGLEDIAGQKGSHSVRDWFERLNANILNPLLTKQRSRNVFDASQIVRAYQKITLQEAMDVIKVSETNVDKKSLDFKRKRDEGTESTRKLSEFSVTSTENSNAKSELNNFLASQENTEALYAMFSQLLDRKLREFQGKVNDTQLNDTSDDDDIKDDYFSAIVPTNSKKDLTITNSAFMPVTKSEVFHTRSVPITRERRLSLPKLPKCFKEDPGV